MLCCGVRGASLAADLRHCPDAKSTNSLATLNDAGFMGDESMPSFNEASRVKPVSSIVPDQIPALSYDECLARLALALEERGSGILDECAEPIGVTAD
jgi:hypothetical protein